MSEMLKQHFWVRMGGPVFCGKRGCNMTHSERSEAVECEGEESGGIKLLRSLKSESALATPQLRSKA